jgi:hypothetical protein
MTGENDLAGDAEERRVGLTPPGRLGDDRYPAVVGETPRQLAAAIPVIVDAAVLTGLHVLTAPTWLLQEVKCLRVRGAPECSFRKKDPLRKPPDQLRHTSRWAAEGSQRGNRGCWQWLGRGPRGSRCEWKQEGWLATIRESVLHPTVRTESSVAARSIQLRQQLRVSWDGKAGHHC